ncbi:MAG: cytochrome c-type biogenesis protein CcmH [Thaumarchaeota archaeon]|nr:cytochrome c-type biogenesis protein CcmH [Nitrososphaerota archaeon]MCL5316962.1 cytochrome c-type biogenesis protein CcmH [Nitrososphaerota archaeon]
MNRAKATGIIVIILALPLISLFSMSLVMPMAQAQGKPNLDSMAKDFYCTCGCNYILGTCESQMTCDVAKSLKAEISSYIQKGMSRDDIINAMTSKYGNTVLATPKAEGFNLALWWYPAAGGIVGIIAIAFLARRRSSGNWRIDPDEVPALNEEELLRQIDIDKSNAETPVTKKYEDILKEKLAGKKYDDMLKDKRKASKSKSKSKPTKEE